MKMILEGFFKVAFSSLINAPNFPNKAAADDRIFTLSSKTFDLKNLSQIKKRSEINRSYLYQIHWIKNGRNKTP